MHLVALVESESHVCCRYRLAALRPLLAAAGHTLKLRPLPRSWSSQFSLGRDLIHADAVILWNDSGEVTEGTEANLVVVRGGVKMTPPVECGLLPGTLRAELLSSGGIVEGRVTKQELASCEIWLINSVRGWMRAVLVDGARHVRTRSGPRR